MVSSGQTEVMFGGSKDLRPVPDPTLLTTAALTREISSLRELLETQVQALKSEHDARFAGMDKAIELIQRAADKVPNEVDLKVGNLQALHDERFRGIATQFIERDSRTEQTARDSKLAIDAALQAAKEAVGKTEASFSKSIDQLGALIGANTKGLEDKIDATKDRITGLEQRVGNSEGRGSGQGSILAAAAVVISVLIAAGGLAVTLAAR